MTWSFQFNSIGEGRRKNMKFYSIWSELFFKQFFICSKQNRKKLHHSVNSYQIYLVIAINNLFFSSVFFSFNNKNGIPSDNVVALFNIEQIKKTDKV